MEKRCRVADDFNGSTMSNWLGNREVVGTTHRRLPVDNLKCCPLCGVLNAVQNAECFVCRWHGAFDHDPVRIESCLVELLDRCPELADAMSEPDVLPMPWWERCREWIAGLFRRRVDLRV